MINDMHYVLIVLVGCIAGIVTGLIGASGVMVVVPAFVMLGYTTSQSIGASLFIDTIASLVVAWTYYQNKNLNLKQGFWIAIGAVVGAQIGSKISSFIPDVGLSNAFSVFLIITAVLFWVRGLRGGSFALPSGSDKKETRLLKILRSNIVFSALFLGTLVGIISGLLGAGGGVMILLILVFVMQYSMHEGIVTSTLIMAFTAASGALGHALSADLPIKAAIWGAVGTLIGGRIAAKFANKINEKMLSNIVSGVFVALAVIMFIVQR